MVSTIHVSWSFFWIVFSFQKIRVHSSAGCGSVIYFLLWLIILALIMLEYSSKEAAISDKDKKKSKTQYNL